MVMNYVQRGILRLGVFDVNVGPLSYVYGGFNKLGGLFFFCCPERTVCLLAVERFFLGMSPGFQKIIVYNKNAGVFMPASFRWI